MLVVGGATCKSYQLSDLTRQQAFIYQNQGRNAQKKGDWETALTYYKKAAYLNPYSPEILNDLALAYAKNGLYKKAEDTLKKAIKVDSDYLSSYYNLAQLYEQMGKIDLAVEYYKLRVKKSTSEEDPWAWKAKQKIYYYENEKNISN
jgi:superkiller protein 3